LRLYTAAFIPEPLRRAAMSTAIPAPRIGTFSVPRSIEAVNQIKRCSNKWRAVAAQTARSRSKLSRPILLIQYIFIFYGYHHTMGSGSEDKSFAEKSKN